MSKIPNILIFALGAGVGCGLTYFWLDKAYKEEIVELERQLRDAYDSMEDTIFEDVEEEPEPTKQEPLQDHSSLKMEMLANKKDITDYANIVKKEEYSEKDKQEEKSVIIDGEITIAEDVEGFGEEPYELVFATYYADGYLVDNYDHIIDIEMIGGKETLEHFGEGDDPDLLHVRNELYEVDYEIDKDDRTYAEVSGKSPAELPDLD